MSAKLSGKGIKISAVLILAVLVLAALFFFRKAGEEVLSEQRFAMSSNAERVRFLNEQGWIVNPDAVSKEEITIPSEINGTYAEYVKLLEEQGFNIRDYMGRNVMRLSYEVLNYPDHPENVTANMLIADDRLIGGDISLNEEGGFTRPLLSEKTRSEIKFGGGICPNCRDGCEKCGGNCSCESDCRCA